MCHRIGVGGDSPSAEVGVGCRNASSLMYVDE